MIDQSKNVAIGVFVVVAIVLFGYVLSFLHPSIGDATTVLRVRFTDIDKISLGTRVNYAGRPLGEVTKIILIEEGREDRTDSTGRAYMYELVLLVDSSVDVHNTDTVTIVTSGLLGERSIGIVPRKASPGEKSIIINDQLIYAKSAGSVEDTLSALSSLGEKAEGMFEGITELIDANSDDLSEVLDSTDEAMKQVAVTVKRANDDDFVGSLQDAAKSFSASMEQLKEQLDQIDKEELWVKISEISDNLNSITASVNKPRKLSETIDNVHLLSERLNRLEQRVEGSWDKVDETMESLQFATENARKISEDGVVIAADAKAFMKTISQGEGTLGRLLNDDDLYLRTTSIMSKAETLMNDINHYGLLFHLNKGWKRTRTKRASNIAALETPSEFRLYFDEELDHINTSLSRVSILLQQADERGAREEIVENSAFADVFLNLMRQVDGLQQSLKYYNENLQEAR